jgi:hypothetical protein
MPKIGQRVTGHTGCRINYVGTVSESEPPLASTQCLVISDALDTIWHRKDCQALVKLKIAHCRG